MRCPAWLFVVHVCVCVYVVERYDLTDIKRRLVAVVGLVGVVISERIADQEILFMALQKIKVVNENKKIITILSGHY